MRLFSNIDADIDDKSLITVLKISGIDMKLITFIKKSFRNRSTKDIIVEVNSEAQKQLRKIDTLKLPWSECKIYEHMYIKRCFKYCGFSHLAKDCTRKQKCAGNHKYSDCKSKDNCCINCSVANNKFKLKLDTNHLSWSKVCSVLQRRMERLRNTIEYNESKQQSTI